MSTSLSWPSVLPKPLLETHGFQPKPPVIRTEVERGKMDQRRRSKQVPTDMPFSLVLNDQEQSIFEAWVEHRALHGARWFAIDLWSGIGLASHEARISTIERYSLLRRGLWRATGTMEIRERPILTRDMLDIALDGGDLYELLDMLSDFHDLVHDELGLDA